MREHLIEDGWRRFLDRLRRLWGRLSPGELAGTWVNEAVSHAGRSPSRRLHGTTAPRTDAAFDHLDVWEDEGGALVRPTITAAPPEH